MVWEWLNRRAARKVIDAFGGCRFHCVAGWRAKPCRQPACVFLDDWHAFWRLYRGVMEGR